MGRRPLNHARRMMTPVSIGVVELAAQDRAYAGHEPVGERCAPVLAAPPALSSAGYSSITSPKVRKEIRMKSTLRITCMVRSGTFAATFGPTCPPTRTPGTVKMTSEST